jgi:O-antigen/teichoic acid export membrane protein
VGSVFLFCFIIFKKQVIQLFDVDEISSWLIFIPITIFAASFYNILNTWFNRKKKYLSLSGNKVMYAGINGSLKIGFQKVFYLGAFGLVLSEAVSQFFATVVFGRIFLLESGLQFFKISKQEIINTMKKYKSFPLYSAPADFVNVFAKELPVLMLSGYYGPSIVGFYMLNKRMLDAPLFLLSNSILEVFRQKASEDYNKYGNCRSIYISTLKKLSLIAIIPFTILFFIAPMLFAFIFGNEWIVSGEFVQIFSIMYFFRFISSPLTYVFYITNKLNLNLLMQIMMLGIVWSSLFIGGYYFKDSKNTMILLSIGYSFMYIVNLIISFYLSNGKARKTI